MVKSHIHLSICVSFKGQVTQVAITKMKSVE